MLADTVTPGPPEGWVARRDGVARAPYPFGAGTADDAAGGGAVLAKPPCRSGAHALYLSQRAGCSLDAARIVVVHFQLGCLCVVPLAASAVLLGRSVLLRLRYGLFALGPGHQRVVAVADGDQFRRRPVVVGGHFVLDVGADA